MISVEDILLVWTHQWIPCHRQECLDVRQLLKDDDGTNENMPAGRSQFESILENSRRDFQSQRLRIGNAALFWRAEIPWKLEPSLALHRTLHISPRSRRRILHVLVKRYSISFYFQRLF